MIEEAKGEGEGGASFLGKYKFSQKKGKKSGPPSKERVLLSWGRFLHWGLSEKKEEEKEITWERKLELNVFMQSPKDSKAM